MYRRFNPRFYDGSVYVNEDGERSLHRCIQHTYIQICIHALDSP